VNVTRFVIFTIVGTVIGLIGGFLPAAVFSNMIVPENVAVSSVVWFAIVGAIVGTLQRRSSPGRLPRWWLLASALGWAALTAVVTVGRGSELMDFWLALPAGFVFSVLIGGAVFFRRRNAPAHAAVQAPQTPQTPQTPGRFSGFRTGAAAIPVYLLVVGIGHIVLAMVMSSQATGPRDGQAFSGTFVLGLVFVMLGLFALPVALGRERGARALLRGALLGLAVATAVITYTASRGYARGGVPGEIHCIVEQGREICPPGDGTWIMDARPDVFVMLVATVVVYALAHAFGRMGWPLSLSPAR
jgi:hypothetical protein